LLAEGAPGLLLGLTSCRPSLELEDAEPDSDPLDPDPESSSEPELSESFEPWRKEKISFIQKYKY